MTTPRDPIEAPATDYEQQLRRLFTEAGPKDDKFFQPVADGLLTGALAAARNEGRQEAVRLDVERLARAIRYLVYDEEHGWPKSAIGFDAFIEGITAEYEREARHGRSSDPTERPEIVAAVEEQVSMLHEGVPNIHRRLGAAPALQATPRPTTPNDGEVSHSAVALQATGEPPEPD